MRDVLCPLMGPDYDRASRIYNVDDNNLLRHITPSHSRVASLGIKSDQIINESVILIRRLSNPVEPIQNIACLSIGEPEQRSLIREALSEKYKDFQTVRGNGECWHRCIGISNRGKWTRLTSKFQCSDEVKPRT